MHRQSANRPPTTLEHPILPRRLKGASTFQRGFAATFVFDVLSRAMVALTLVLLLRSLSVEAFAFMILLLNVGRFMSSSATGGLRLRYVRTEAERVSRGDSQPTSFYLVLRNGSVLVAGVAALGFAGATALGVGTPHERLAFTLIATVFTLGHSAVEMAVYHYQAQLAFTRAGVIGIVRGAAQLGPALLAAFGVLEGGEAVGTVFALCMATLGIAVTVPLAARTRHVVEEREGRFGFGRESASLTLYSLALAGSAHINVFLVAALLDDVAVVVFGAALRYVQIITGPVPALVSVLRVRTAQRDMVESEHAQLRLMVNWAKRAALPLVVVLGGAAALAPFAIPIIDGDKYPLSIPVFEVLLIMAFAQLITLPSSSLLITQKRYPLLAWINAGTVLLNAAVVVAVAPLLGVVGVAGVAALATIGQVGAQAWFAAHPPARAPVEAARPEPAS